MLARRLVASLASLAAAAALFLPSSPDATSVWIFVGLLALAAGLVHHDRVESRLVARAVWWSNLLLGAILCVYGSSHERTIGLELAAATAFALLVVPAADLDTARAGAFAPIAFRRTLLGTLVLSLVDAQLLLLAGALGAEKIEADWTVAPPLVLAALLLIGAVGVLRLRVWGVALTALVRLALCALAAFGLVRLYVAPIPTLMTVDSALQLALLVPLVVALARGTAPRARAVRASVWLPRVLAVGVLAVATAGWLRLFRG